MRSLKIIYDGSGYGNVLTAAEPTSFGVFRVETADVVDLAQLVADVLGLPQPLLDNHLRRNLARWLLRYGQQEFGRPFMQACARALIWQEKSHP